jgi:hypothetical protein
MPKKIFIFEPSTAWNYCGGMVVVIATVFEEAVELAMNYEEDGEKCLQGDKFYEKLEDISELEKLQHGGYYKRDGWDEWVLSRVYEVSETTKNEVLVNYNYA